MKFPRPLLLMVTLSVLMALVASPAQAQSERAAERRPAPEQEAGASPEREWPARPSRNRQSSLSDAVRRVQRETGGQVLGAERVQFDGRDINRVKVMDERGRIRYMDEDPQQGREHESRLAPRARRDNPSPP